jgi:methionyl-tRNA formyltransferase
VLNGEVIKLQSAHISGAAYPHEIRAGSILSIQNESENVGIDVATGDGVLRITHLQKSGGKSLPVADFLRGFDVQPGMYFSSAAP